MNGRVDTFVDDGDDATDLGISRALVDRWIDRPFLDVVALSGQSHSINQSTIHLSVHPSDHNTNISPLQV